MIDGILPNMSGQQPWDTCLMAYDWTRQTGKEWFSLAEHAFSMSGIGISEATGNCNDRHSHGNYARVRNRVHDFFRAPRVGSFDARFLSARVNGESFSPSNVSFVVGDSAAGKRAAILVRKGAVSQSNMFDVLAGQVSEIAGTWYGGIWDFPSAYGPACYLFSVHSVPRGQQLFAQRAYAARIKRWADNTIKRGLHPRQGYFREIYPINFITDAHLAMPFRDRPLRFYLEGAGKLEDIYNGAGMYRWEITADELETARADLEASGLVLSSETQPLFLH